MKFNFISKPSTGHNFQRERHFKSSSFSVGFWPRFVRVWGAIRVQIILSSISEAKQSLAYHPQVTLMVSSDSDSPPLFPTPSSFPSLCCFVCLFFFPTVYEKTVESTSAFTTWVALYTDYEFLQSTMYLSFPLFSPQKLSVDSAHFNHPWRRPLFNCPHSSFDRKWTLQRKTERSVVCLCTYILSCSCRFLSPFPFAIFIPSSLKQLGCVTLTLWPSNLGSSSLKSGQLMVFVRRITVIFPL